jgi:prevent-host-death family protein
MSLLEHPVETLSVSDASARGIAGLVKDAEDGRSIVVSRHGRPVAAVVAMARFDSIEELEDDLRSACLVLARAATDNNSRVGLEDLITELGFDQAELNAELNAEIVSQATQKTRSGTRK